MDLSLGSDLTCWRASCKLGSGGLSVRFSRVVGLSSVGLTGYARTGVRQSTKTKKLHEKIEGLEMWEHHCGLFGGCKGRRTVTREIN